MTKSESFTNHVNLLSYNWRLFGVVNTRFGSGLA